MSKAADCSHLFLCSRYNMMLHCWNHSPDLRPSFSDLVILLEDLLQSSQEYLDITSQAQPVLTYQPDQYLQPNPGPGQGSITDQRTSCSVSLQQNLASKTHMEGYADIAASVASHVDHPLQC